MSRAICTPKPGLWAPALGSLAVLVAVAAGSMGAGAAQPSAAPSPGKVYELRQVADRALDDLLRPGAVTGARAEAAEALARTQAAPPAEQVVREIVRPDTVSDTHAAVVAAPEKAAGPGFVADTHAAAGKVLTDTHAAATRVIRTLVPGSG